MYCVYQKKKAFSKSWINVGGSFFYRLCIHLTENRHIKKHDVIDDDDDADEKVSQPQKWAMLFMREVKHGLHQHK